MFLAKKRIIFTIVGFLIISSVIYLWHLFSQPHTIELLGQKYIYEGEMEDGMANGFGKLYKIGDLHWLIFYGNFKDDKLNGYGTIEQERGKPWYTGQFSNNVPNGSGTFWNLSKVDRFSNHQWGMKETLGLDSQIAYNGEIKNGRPNGQGDLLVSIDGIGEVNSRTTLDDPFLDIFKGYFSDGAYIGDDSSIKNILALNKEKIDTVRTRSHSRGFGSTIWPSDQDMRNDAQDGSYSYEEVYGGGVEDDQTHHVDPHWVDEYERSDGTEVDGYWRGGDDGYMRSDPDQYEWNNLNP